MADTQTTSKQTPPILFRLSDAEREDLVKRAGEKQAVDGREIVTLQDYIRSQLWPNGSPSA